MSKVVLDSCVFSKLFLQEPDRQEAVELITELSKRNTQVLVPSLFLYEVLSIVELNQQTTLKAIEICEQGHEKSRFPSFYDASYPALAITNECQFITADKRHMAKTKRFGYVALLSDWESVFK